MITFRFKLTNPYARAKFFEIMQKTIQITKHKFLEIEMYHENATLYELYVDLNWRGFDHAGPCVEIGLFSKVLRCALHDSRHWNRKTNSWEITNEIM